MTDTYFLSADNPIANIDQRDLEATALRLMERPELQRARAAVAYLWRQAVEYPARDQMSNFDSAIDEFSFHFALRAANGDACYPKVLRVMQPPAQWFARNTPGSRWGGDSPDFIYRFIPIAHGARYEIRIKPTCSNPPMVTYTLTSNTPSPITLGSIDSRDLQTQENGETIITIDATSAEGRPNHLQTQPGEHHLLIRDVLVDWLMQTPHVVRAQRLDKPERPPLSEEELAKRGARSLVDSMYYAYYCTQSGSGQPPNEFRAPASSGLFGGLAVQWGSKGNVLLGDNEALVITANSAGAQFRNVCLCDIFFRSVNYWAHQGSLNNAQMAADDDGRFTYVIAHQDPGVHNWLDTGGLIRTILGHRWQWLPPNSAEIPAWSARVVKFNDLEKVLPKGIRQISIGERHEQIAAREAGFKRRFIDR